MNVPERGRTVFIKKTILYGLFTIFLIFLFTTAENFVQNQKYFSLTKDFSIPYLIILLVLLVNSVLILQTIKNKKEAVTLPIIFFFLSFIFLRKYGVAEAFLGSFLFSIYWYFQLKKSKSLSDNSLKINLKYTTGPGLKAFLLSVSAVISIAVMLNRKNVESVDVGEWATKIAEKPIEQAVQTGGQEAIPEDIKSLNLQSIQGANPQLFSVLKSFGVDEISVNLPSSEGLTNNVTDTIKKSMSDQINKLVEPYKKYFAPTLALLVFGILQIYGSLVYFIYTIICNTLLLLLKKTKFIEIQKIPSEQEKIVL